MSRKVFTAALIGAGEEALHAVRCAAEMGIKTVALDKNPGAAAMFEASKALPIDISDADAVTEALKKEGADFILPAPVGRFVTTWGKVNDALGLRGVSEEAALLCADKWQFHETLNKAGLRDCECMLLPAGRQEEVLRRLQADDTDRLPEAPSREGIGGIDGCSLPARLAAQKESGKEHFSAILKPRFGSGSRGVSSVESMEELEQLLSESADEDLILEEEVPGMEYGADGAVIDGEFYLILLRKKLNTEKPVRQALGYFTEYDEELNAAAKELLAKIAETLGIRDSLFHADLILRDAVKADSKRKQGLSGGGFPMAEVPQKRGFFPIEVSCRPSGHYLHDVFTPLATGVDMVGEYIRFQTWCGSDPGSGPEGTAGDSAQDGSPGDSGISSDFSKKAGWDFKPRTQRRLLIRFLDLPPGIVEYVPQYHELDFPEGISLRMMRCGIHPGDRLGAVTDGHSLIGRGYLILEYEREPEEALMDDGLRVWEKRLLMTAEDVLGAFVVRATSSK